MLWPGCLVQAETLQELMETGEGLVGARWGERMVMVMLPGGHSQFMSGAHTRAINGKEDPLWEDLEL